MKNLMAQVLLVATLLSSIVVFSSSGGHDMDQKDEYAPECDCYYPNSGQAGILQFVYSSNAFDCIPAGCKLYSL